MRVRARVLGALAVLALVLVSCAGVAPERASEPTGVPVGASDMDGTPAPPVPVAQPPAKPTYSKIRVFVAAEGPYHGGTGDLHVLEASGGEFTLVKKIPQGGWPHNVAVSPDGKWVAVANRSSNQVSIVDPVEMTEVARVAVGKVPHAILWHPDGKTLFVGAEKETFITRLEAGTWKQLARLEVGVFQHVFAMREDRPNELWFSVTMSNVGDHARVYHLDTGKVTNIRAHDVHDLYFTPDGSELWSGSSGFLEKPADRMLIYDPIEKVVKGEVKFPGRYPFHTIKRFQDGMFYPPDTSIMLLSSHYSAEKGTDGASLLWVDWKARKIVDETPIGRHPFHSTYDPLGQRILTTSNVDGMVNVIDWKTRKVVQKIAVPKAHGIVAVGIP
ncbi:MAG: beta-propeller fold lactonase family protein [Chloroflexota bacterium]